MLNGANVPGEVPGPLGENGVFDTINGKEIRWSDKRGLVHVAVGADVHPGVRLLWTLCDRDVPANTAWLLERGMAHEMCMICAKRRREVPLNKMEVA